MSEEEQDSFSAIWRDRGKIMRDRHRKMDEVMKEYDTTVHGPSLKALMERCEKLGHKNSGDTQDNGLGWWWVNCEYCGKRLEEGRYENIPEENS